ncbi:hypothetical protein HOLleu_41809 [Holothuria leucospilota]|uniref:Uncharacterized protein n=1 Tax=Holothuria leucospilota TaxID=206669 RepID=A0A9Q0YC84_HOLLE|nr:hypothetical protein HOLleu_41809 [Holothuria leucospilota]
MMRLQWYILQVIVLVIILATCLSLTNAQRGCCSRVVDCNIPRECFCPLKKSMCKDGARRHFISGKRSDINWNYPPAEDDWNEFKYLLNEDRETDRPLNSQTITRTLIRRLGVDPDLLITAFQEGNSKYGSKKYYEES